MWIFLILKGGYGNDICLSLCWKFRVYIYILYILYIYISLKYFIGHTVPFSYRAGESLRISTSALTSRGSSQATGGLPEAEPSWVLKAEMGH